MPNFSYNRLRTNSSYNDSIFFLFLSRNYEAKLKIVSVLYFEKYENFDTRTNFLRYVLEFWWVSKYGHKDRKKLKKIIFFHVVDISKHKLKKKIEENF